MPALGSSGYFNKLSEWAWVIDWLWIHLQANVWLSPSPEIPSLTCKQIALTTARYDLPSPKPPIIKNNNNKHGCFSQFKTLDTYDQDMHVVGL